MNSRISAGTFWGFLAGGLIGAAVALLYAPRSGSETRQKLAEDGQKLKDSAIESIKGVRDSAEATIKDAQARINLVAQETKDFVERLKDVDPETVTGRSVAKKADALA
ncbi:MAG: YtxH domain-containing protein [Anaerolineales bacterium]|nr:YtxH domain-containing protein [Anaerolineales bacterium]